MMDNKNSLKYKMWTNAKLRTATSNNCAEQTSIILEVSC